MSRLGQPVALTLNLDSELCHVFNKNTDHKLPAAVRAVLPEASCKRVEVVVDVGDDGGEPNDAGSVRVFIGSSGHAERCLLMDANNTAVAETTAVTLRLGLTKPHC